MCFFFGEQFTKHYQGWGTVNLDESKSIGTHKIVLYVNSDSVTYFDSFGVEHILE